MEYILFILFFLFDVIRYYGDFKSVDPDHHQRHHNRNSISYDTCTYFDKHMDNTANLQERYTKEIEQLRGKLRELKGDPPKYERRRLFDDMAFTPKELVMKTNAASANKISNNNSSNSNNKPVASEVS